MTVIGEQSSEDINTPETTREADDSRTSSEAGDNEDIASKEMQTLPAAAFILYYISAYKVDDVA